jgi:hypothetical protein
MNVKLHDDTVVTVKEPTELEQLEYFEMVEAHAKLQVEKGSLDAARETIAWTDKFLAKHLGVTPEKVSEMPLVDKHLVMAAIRARLTYIGPGDTKKDF